MAYVSRDFKGTSLLNQDAFRIQFEMLAPELHAAAMEALGLLMEEVKVEAVSKANMAGFTPPGRSGRATGALIGKIRAGVVKGKAKGYVVDKAINRDASPPFAYPKMYEYGNGGARAFMRPAINSSAGKIYAGIDEAITNVVIRWNTR